MKKSQQKRKSPCKECPFRKNNKLKGEFPGGSHPFVYVGQSVGPFWLPCHMDKEYNDKESDPKAVDQCAGAAIYRANTGSASRMPEPLLSLPKDMETVFKSHEEFLSHYLNIPEDQISLSEDDLRILLEMEVNKIEVKKVEL